MRKLPILIIGMMFFATIAVAQDRPSGKIEFRRVLWICPVCGVEEPEDRPPDGGASYEHTCKNGHTFNQSGPNMKNYDGCINIYAKPIEINGKKYIPLPPDEEVTNEKNTKFDAWLYESKHPAPYQEPSVSDLENEKADLMQRVNSLQQRIDEKATAIND